MVIFFVFSFSIFFYPFFQLVIALFFKAPVSEISIVLAWTLALLSGYFSSIQLNLQKIPKSTILFLGLFLNFFYFLIEEYKLQKNCLLFLKKFIFLLATFAIIHIITINVPSAFLKGPNYEPLLTSFRFMHYSFILEVFNFLRLNGILSLFSFILSIYILISSWNRSIRYKKIVLLLCFIQIITLCFPLLIRVDNIAQWDTIHKFALINYLLAILLPVFSLKEFKKLYTLFLVVFIINIVFSLPNYRLQSRYFSWKYTSPIPSETRDIITFLKKSNQLKTLIPFSSGSNVGVATPRFHDIAAIGILSKKLFTSGYNPTFLFSKKIEDSFMVNFTWFDSVNKFNETLNNIISDPSMALIIHKKDLPAFVSQRHDES